MTFPHLLAAALLLAPLPASAGEPAERPLGTQLGEQLKSAVNKGDVHLMNALRGTQLKVRLTTKKVWRATKGYRDLLVAMTIDGREVEALVRLPSHLAPAGGKATYSASGTFNASGTLVDFEPFASGGRIAWQPVMLIATLP